MWQIVGSRRNFSSGWPFGDHAIVFEDRGLSENSDPG
jgi:hypothetical protein